MLDSDQKEIAKKIGTGFAIVLIGIGLYFFLYAPPSPLSNRNQRDYLQWKWDKYETPFYTLYHPPEYQLSAGNNMQNLSFKMPGNKLAFKIKYQSSPINKTMFQQIGGVPKRSYKSGFLNDNKAWVYERRGPNGGINAFIEKNRKSIIIQGFYHNQEFANHVPPLQKQRDTLIKIIESVQFNKM